MKKGIRSFLENVPSLLILLVIAGFILGLSQHIIGYSQNVSLTLSIIFGFLIGWFHDDIMDFLWSLYYKVIYLLNYDR